MSSADFTIYTMLDLPLRLPCVKLLFFLGTERNSVNLFLLLYLLFAMLLFCSFPFLSFLVSFGQQVNAGSRVSHHGYATAADANVEVW